MSRLAEITAFVTLADGALLPEMQIRAIHRRWPAATGEEICEAMQRSALGLPEDAEGRSALDAAVNAMLGGRRGGSA